MLGIWWERKHCEGDDSVEVIRACLACLSNDSVDLVAGILYLKPNSRMLLTRERVGHDHDSTVLSKIQVI